MEESQKKFIPEARQAYLAKFQEDFSKKYSRQCVVRLGIPLGMPPGPWGSSKYSFWVSPRIFSCNCSKDSCPNSSRYICYDSFRFLQWFFFLRIPLEIHPVTSAGILPEFPLNLLFEKSCWHFSSIFKRNIYNHCSWIAPSEISGGFPAAITWETQKKIPALAPKLISWEFPGIASLWRNPIYNPIQ